MKVRLFCLALALVSIGCSARFRTSDPDLTYSELLSLLSEAQENGVAVQASSTGDASSDPGMVIYYADAYAGPPGPFGTIDSVLAFHDIGSLGLAIPRGSITGVRVFFIDNANSNPRNQLIVGLYDSVDSRWVYASCSGNSSVDGGEFRADLSGDCNISVSSFDVDGSSLNATIALRVSSTGGYAGKFPSLSGFR